MYLLIPVFMGTGIKILLQEYLLDQNYTHFLLLVLVPVLFAISLVNSLGLHLCPSANTILLVVLHSSTRPERHDDNRSNCTLF